MVDTLENIIATITEIIKTIGPVAGFFMIILESVIPVLPLGAFIALNNIVFGSAFGFLISWVATIVGCLISFYAFRLGVSKTLYRHIKIDGKVHKFMEYLSKMEVTKLTLLVALPFAPAFLINIASGLSRMPVKRFVKSILIGKIAVVYFWGYIGTSLVESIRNPIILLRISVIIAMAYFVSKLIETFLSAKGKR